MRCENCQKGKEYGHNVSAAKNRTRRLFLPNLQQLKVLSGGNILRVKLCTRCIKRMKKDGKIGKFTQLSVTSEIKKTDIPKIGLPKVKKEEKKETVKETMDIAAIVGSKK